MHSQITRLLCQSKSVSSDAARQHLPSEYLNPMQNVPMRKICCIFEITVPEQECDRLLSRSRDVRKTKLKLRNSVTLRLEVDHFARTDDDPRDSGSPVRKNTIGTPRTKLLLLSFFNPRPDG